jgi:L-iditol 2-dehydrogenase
VDVAITACSVGQAQEDALRIAAKRGRISLFGGIPGNAKGFLDSNEIHYKELSVFGVHASTPDQNRTILNAISNGSLKVKKYISKVYDLENIVDAFEDLKNQRVLKAIVKP